MIYSKNCNTLSNASYVLVGHKAFANWVGGNTLYKTECVSFLHFFLMRVLLKKMKCLSNVKNKKLCASYILKDT
jgi:hypothetical protein